MDDVDQRRSSTAPRYAGALMLAAVAGHLLSEAATGSLKTWQSWVLYCLGATLLVLSASAIDRLNQLVKRIRLRWVVFTAVLVVAAGVVVLAAPPVVAYGRVLLLGCPQPVEVRVLTSQDAAPAVGEVARKFEQHTAAENHGCRTARLYVFSAPGTRGAIALRSSWSSQDLREVGPHPDVWLPDSTTETNEVVRRTGGIGSAVRIRPGESVAFSPVVLAVPGPIARDVVSGSAETWGELLTKVGNTGITIGRPNPLLAIDGRLAAQALYETLEPAVVERRVVEADRPRPGAAMITTEQVLMRHNKTSCAQKPCLTALYPSDTYRADYPLNLVEWDAPDVSNHAAREPAKAFQAWLGTQEGMTALNVAGLRPARQAAGAEFREELGVRAGLALDRAEAAPGEAAQAEFQKKYQQAKRDGRVWLTLDASGSMVEPTATGETRFAVAVEGVRKALTQMGAKDTYGLSVFNNDDVRPLIPLGRRDREAATAALGTVTPSGGTPLHQAILDSLDRAGADDANHVSAVIALTDGEDTTSAQTRQDVVEAVRQKGIRVFVIAVGDASCAAHALTSITDAAGGECRDSTTDTLGDDLAALFRRVWGGAA
ncbi:von Willebrand factor type A domain-containing protein [Lentzea xinjiangensis]|uniref:von Willebrand factor type A domain-containing protein n=1 Tax=Lentzea xinjiangensis TaxID=402600 RepID=A0A1H9SAH5_9PSEU|nr:VWA domain-containing protein [Lentzea xinjiangensis]SER82004.1 von Willebrand factor type A domain-containing protein [Lentzea xinjiangensis]